MTIYCTNKALQRPGQISEPLFDLHTFRVWGDRFTHFFPSDQFGCCGIVTFYDEEEEEEVASIEVYNDGEIPVKAPWGAILYIKETDLPLLPLYLREKLAKLRGI